MEGPCRKHFEWHERYILPIIRAAVDGNEAAMSEALTQAEQAVTGTELSHDARVSLALMVRYVCLVQHLAVNDRESFVDGYQAAVDFIQNMQSVGRDSDCVRRTNLMQLRILGALHGISPMTKEEFHKLIATVPETERWLEQWHYITALAFLLGDNETVRHGYETFLEYHSAYQQDFLFRRYDVMSRIVSGQATYIDAIKLIDDSTLPGHIREVATVFWPRLAQAGLVDSGLEDRLGRKLAEVCS
jgi:hypothetical protein